MARHRLRNHAHLPANAALPQLGDVLALIEREEVAGGHWYWLDDFSRDREALMTWRLPEGAAAKLAVPRLLHQLMGDCPRGSGVLNECGLVSCVNPSHWSVETPEQRGQKAKAVVLTDFHGHGWTPARTTKCTVCHQPENKPCDPVVHDADYRRRMVAMASTCTICGAPPDKYCDDDIHKHAFQVHLRKLRKRGTVE